MTSIYPAVFTQLKQRISRSPVHFSPFTSPISRLLARFRSSPTTSHLTDLVWTSWQGLIPLICVQLQRTRSFCGDYTSPGAGDRVYEELARWVTWWRRQSYCNYAIRSVSERCDWVITVCVVLCGGGGT